MVRQGDGWDQGETGENSGQGRMSIPDAAAIKEQARHVAEQARRGAAVAADQGKRLAAEKAEASKGWAVDELSHLSAAARSAAQKLREEEDARVAAYAEAMAERVDRVAGYLRGHAVRDLAQDAGRMVRRHPELVMGAFFLAGMAAARFFKASDIPSRGQMMNEDYAAAAQWDDEAQATEGMTEFPERAAEVSAPAAPGI